MSDSLIPTVSLHQLNGTMNQKQPLALKQGQVIHGTIKQLYPNQMAEVQIGNDRIMAKMEVPLQLGKSHYFQVSGVKPDLQLRVISGPMASSVPLSKQVSQLLDALHLPQTNDMKQITTYFLNNNLPFSKELLQQAEQLLKGLPSIPSKEALTVIQKLVNLRLPIQQDTFQAVLQGSLKQGFIDTLDHLQQLIKQDMSIGESVREQLANKIQMVSKPFSEETGGVLLAKMVDMLSNPSTSKTDQLAIVQLLKEAQILQKNANLFNWENGLKQFTNRTNTKNSIPQTMKLLMNEQQLATPSEKIKWLSQIKSSIKNESFLSTTQKEGLLRMVENFDVVKSTSAALNDFIKKFQSQLQKGLIESIQQKPFQINSQGVSAKEQLMFMLNPQISENNQVLERVNQLTMKATAPVLQQMLEQAEHHIANHLDSSAFQKAIKQTLHHLGLSYEARLRDKSSDVKELAQQLKPQLVGLLQDDSVSSQTKSVAEQVVARMNGMQYLSGENGPLHQLIMQVPLEFFGKKTEATLQWNGRMKDDGKIDAEYARILFYLQLHSLKETVVDMQVQNRIVTITVYNETAGIEELAKPLKSSLKTSLAKYDYHLSGLFIKNYTKEQPLLNNLSLSTTVNNKKGVDIRI
ncbi:hypothetical protein ACWV26_04555 [Rummeliibacillus sp. JY-2-4R]